MEEKQEHLALAPWTDLNQEHVGGIRKRSAQLGGHGSSAGHCPSADHCLEASLPRLSQARHRHLGYTRGPGFAMATVHRHRRAHPARLARACALCTKENRQGWPALSDLQVPHHVPQPGRLGPSQVYASLCARGYGKTLGIRAQAAQCMDQQFCIYRSARARNGVQAI